jgi:hypothetical protein
LAHLAGGGGTGAVISAPLANDEAPGDKLAQAMMALAEKKKLVLRMSAGGAEIFFFSPLLFFLLLNYYEGILQASFFFT